MMPRSSILVEHQILILGVEGSNPSGVAKYHYMLDYIIGCDIILLLNLEKNTNV